MSNIRVRVGQQNSVKVVSSLSASTTLINGITILDNGSVVGVSRSTFTLNFEGETFVISEGSDGIINVGIINFIPSAGVATNVIGGIASVSTLSVSGISTIGNIVVGLNTITTNNGNLVLQSQDSQVVINDDLNILGFATISQGLYYPSGQFYSPNGVAYFNNSGKLVSSGSTLSSVSETNYILTTNNVGDPIWSNVLDGGEY